MENHKARESLDALAEVQQQNQRRLVRPRRYWVMFGGMMALFGLFPYMEEWPFWLRVVLIIAVATLLGFATGWRRPSTARKVRMNSGFLPMLLVLMLGVVTLVTLSRYFFVYLDWWWAPAVSACLIFALVNVVGPAMDRGWVRRAAAI